MRTLLVCCALGALVGAGLVWATLSGLIDSVQVAWQQLPATPQPSTGLGDSPGGTVVAQTADGTLYTCTPAEARCWEEAPETPAEVVASERCGFITVTNFVLSHRGAGIDQCRAAESRFDPDGSRVERIVLDRSGVIWYQQSAVTPATWFFLSLQTVPFGALAGLAVGVVILLIRGRFGNARRG